MIFQDLCQEQIVILFTLGKKRRGKVHFLSPGTLFSRASGRNGLPVRIILQPMEFTGLFDLFAIDGLPVITHGNDLISHSLPFFGQFVMFRRIPVIPHFIIRYQHECRAAVAVVQERIIVHADVTGAVAEGQHRLAADLLGDLQYFVCLQILDDQPVRAHQRIVARKHILNTVRVSLVPGRQRGIGTDDVLIGNIKHPLNESPDNKPVASRDHKTFEAVILQVFHHLNHGKVEGTRIGHALKTVRLMDQETRDKIGIFIQGHAGEGFRLMVGKLIIVI